MEARAHTPVVDERELYPIHEEDDVPEIPFHKAQTTYLYDALSVYFADRFVSGNICIYWEPGNYNLYRAPDAFVAQGKPAETYPRVYWVWEDPPILFAAEIGSRSTFRADEGPKVEIYRENIRAREYLYSDPPNGLLRLWRLGENGDQEVVPGPNGRVRSAVLDLGFGLEDGWLWIYTPEGERLRTYEESERDRLEAEQERRDTQARVAEEARLRQEAQARVAAEVRLRQEAEARAAEAERRLAQLEADLKRRGA